MSMVDMALTGEELKENTLPAMPEMASQPRYPYGLSISLSEKELEKLKLSAECEVGDMIHLVGMAKVTSISANDTQDGKSCRIELQITHLELEDEDEEVEEEGFKRPLGSHRPY